MSVKLLVLQATPFCNIDCSYCYLPDRGNHGRMSEEIIQAVGEKIVRSDLAANDLSILWHAGEPLVLPPEYYREAFDVLHSSAPSRVRLTHKIQTNGTLLSDEWCRLLREHGVVVGISLDGPEQLHDLNRKTRNGSGTFAKVLAGAKLLHEYEIPFSVTAVLTRPALDEADQVFDVFEQLKPAKTLFNVEEIEGCHSITSLGFDGVEVKYRAFLERYWDLIERTRSRQRVRHYALHTRHRFARNRQLRCAAVVVRVARLDGECVHILTGTSRCSAPVIR